MENRRPGRRNIDCLWGTVSSLYLLQIYIEKNSAKWLARGVEKLARAAAVAFHGWRDDGAR